ncbi:MAG: ComEC/Rec2 family competence protein [Paludibacteraceae bacterium]|nr:ComEC/Rec2 family competence protein [Paludibacteraceae bacterium]
MVRKFPILFLLVPWIVLIVCADRLNWHHFLGMPEPLDSVPRLYYAVVQDSPKPCPRSWRVEVEMMPDQRHAYLYLQKDTTRMLPALGDTIMVCTGFKQGSLLGDFDYGRYLLRNGIAGTSFVRSSEWKMTGQAVRIPWHLRPRAWQHAAFERYKEAGLNGDALATTAALTLGYKDDLDPQLKSHFQKAGAAHILAVSGLHTGIVYGVLFFLLTLFGLFPPLYEARRHQALLSGVIIIALIAYALLTGGSPSVVRSVLFIVLLEAAKVWHRQAMSINTLFVTAFLILFFRPLDLFSVSFQLSFAAVAGILLFEPALRRLFPLPLRSSGFGFRVAEYIRGLLIVSIAAQVFTIPLTLYYFSQTSNLFFVTNLLVIPLAFLLMVSALLLLTAGWFPIAERLFAFTTERLADTMNRSVQWVEHLPHSVTAAAMPPSAMIAMYLLIFLFVILLNRITA